MFIELTNRNNNAKVMVNTDQIELVDDAEYCLIWLVGATNSIKPVESYADIVSMLAPQQIWRRPGTTPKEQP